MNRPLAALWRRRQALVDIKSAPPAIPLDTPVTGMVLAREVQKKEKSSNYNFQDDGDTSSVPAVHVKFREGSIPTSKIAENRRLG